jgi:hypothetical protein
MKQNTTLIILFLLLLTLPSPAQEYPDNYFLENRTIQSQEEVTIIAMQNIYNQPGNEYIVDIGGSAVLRAGKRIELREGFKVVKGGRLSASAENFFPSEEYPGETSPTVSPNPTLGLLNIVSPENVTSIRLTDMTGLQLMEQKDINQSEFSIDISKVDPGFYILEIVSYRSAETVRIEKN